MDYLLGISLLVVLVAVVLLASRLSRHRWAKVIVAALAAGACVIAAHQISASPAAVVLLVALAILFAAEAMFGWLLEGAWARLRVRRR